jgi:hypothetical protein
LIWAESGEAFLSNVLEYLGRGSSLAQPCSHLRAVSKYIDLSMLSYLDSSCLS